MCNLALVKSEKDRADNHNAQKEFEVKNPDTNPRVTRLKIKRTKYY